MKKLFTLLFALMLNAAAFAQGFNVEVCVTLTGPPLTGPIAATLTYFTNNGTSTFTLNIVNNPSLPYQLCFPAYLQMPDSGNYAFASGNIQLSNCGPMQTYSYSQLISGNTTINVNAQNCSSSAFCGVTLSPVGGTTNLIATATGVAPFTYSWDGGVTYSSNNTLTMNGPGVYCVTALDASGCSSTDCYTNNNNNCAATINVTGSGPWTLDASSTGTPPFNFIWSNGATTSSIVAATPGQYCVAVFDANNCTDSVCFFIQGPNNCGASIIFGNNPATGDFLTALPDSNAFMGVTFLWNTGETSASIYPNSPGQYCVTISYLNGCTATSCYNYTGGSSSGFCSVFATAIPDSSNTGFVFFSSFPTGTAPFSYSWVFSNGTTSTQANPYINMNNNTGLNWGFLTVTDATGCVSYYTVSVVLPNNNLNCNAFFSMAANYNTGTPGEIFFQDQSFATGGVVTYAWDFGDNNISNLQNPNHTYASAGFYSVCLTISGGNGCAATWCTNMYVDPAWWTSSPFQGVCTAGFLILNNPNNSAGMVSIVNTSQGNNLYYTWDFGNGIVYNTPTPFFTFSSSGVYPICLTILDTMSSCTDTYCDTITVDSLGNITRSPLNGNVGVVVYASAQPNDLLSISNQSSNSALVLTPNPSNGTISFSTEGKEGSNLIVEVINISGQNVYQQLFKAGKGINNTTIDLSHLSNGAYMMKITSSEGVKTSRLIMQK